MTATVLRPAWTPPTRSRIIAIAIALVATNLGDALFTLYLLDHGFREANPVMLWLLARGTATFVAAKLGVSAAVAARLGYATMAGHRRAWRCLSWGTFTYALLCLGYAIIRCAHVIF